MTKFLSRHATTDAIQWTVDNLAEVLEFTGKHPLWDKWFSSFEEYEARVKADGGLFKLICGPTTKHANPGDWIVRNFIGYNHVMPNDIFVDAYVSLEAQTSAPLPDGDYKRDNGDVITVVDNKVVQVRRVQVRLQSKLSESLTDIKTHHKNWKRAMEMARENCDDQDDCLYWVHEMNVLDRIADDLESIEGGES